MMKLHHILTGHQMWAYKVEYGILNGFLRLLYSIYFKYSDHLILCQLVLFADNGC